MSRVEDLIVLSKQGDLDAKRILIEENSGLIWSVARRFAGRGTELEDLFQIGCLGFLKAIDGFDITYGTVFSTYAVPKITGEIRRFLRDDGVVKVSRTIKERAAIIKKAYGELINTLGRDVTIQEIADRTGFTIEEIAIAEQATSFVESINQETGEDGFSLENRLSDTDSEETMLEKFALKQAIERLPEKESMVIRLRYFHGLTQDRVSKILSVSQVQISRIEKKALELLRELLC